MKRAQVRDPLDRRRTLPVDQQKVNAVEVVKPDSLQDAIENLFIFDARGLDQDTRIELIRILPQLVHIGRAWKAEFMECGCTCCHKKKKAYGSGGLCNDCQRRIVSRMRNRYRKAMKGRDLPAELEALKNALCLRYNAAQRLFNGED
jgi:hypothetical protein